MQTDSKNQNLFIYGSLLLNRHNLGFIIKPMESVFVKGYKITIEKSPITKTNYHYIKLVFTGNEQDIVPGFLTRVSEEELKLLDAYEGDSYTRTRLECYDREINKCECYAYIARK